MAIQTLNTIKNWFKTSLKPTQQQFWDTWDSFRHKNEKLPIQDIENLEMTLNSKAEKSELDAHKINVSAHSELFNTKENIANKGIANGYAPLNGFTKLAAQYLDIINDLVSGGSNSLLSAEQGKILQNQINIINTLLQSNNVNPDKFDEIARMVENIQTWLNYIVINDLTSGGMGYALSAEMGKKLNEIKLTATIATDAETQISNTIEEDNKVISRSNLLNWWNWLAMTRKTITGDWNFENGLRFPNSQNGLTINSEINSGKITVSEKSQSNIISETQIEPSALTLKNRASGGQVLGTSIKDGEFMLFKDATGYGDYQNLASVGLSVGQDNKLSGQLSLTNENGISSFLKENPESMINGTYFYLPKDITGEPKTLATTDDTTPTTLQQMLDNSGNIASVDGGSSSIGILYGNEYDRGIYFRSYNPDSGSILDFRNKKATLSNYNRDTDKTGNISVVSGGIQLDEVINSGAQTIFVFETPIAIGSPSIIKVPAKTSGEYTLLLKEDLKSYSNGGVFTITGDDVTYQFNIPHGLMGTVKMHFVTTNYNIEKIVFDSYISGSNIVVSFTQDIPSNGQTIKVNWGAFQ